LKATELIEILQDLIKTNGDHDVVVGIERTGYGEPVEDATFVSAGDVGSSPTLSSKQKRIVKNVQVINQTNERFSIRHIPI
jgi:hypothetical protein